MNYRIKIRQLTDNDLGRDCQFPNTDSENYITHVDSLLESLRAIETIDTVNEIGGTIIIESQLTDKDDFWSSIKFLFEDEKENIKFLSAEQVA
ncbi:hypothetical protein [Pseudoalteromonas sp. SR45-5]|uniref:hypothetical protein n=1 Tax=Pseudoalteromonas sp. SR45-5 TaxID=2760928 RepID=UPI0015F98D82|nr:hypothetical protein [Pseudoalteromonas sp. SR45-5]MBB1353515.1 hypothetical protein [Pseudoalteromonas sp. SR45-5]